MQIAVIYKSCVACVVCTWYVRTTRFWLSEGLSLYCFFISLSRRNLLLIEFDAQVALSAKRMRRRGEMSVSVSNFLVSILKRSHKIIPSPVLMCSSLAVRSLLKSSGIKHGDRVCREWPHSVAKPEGILQRFQ